MIARWVVIVALVVLSLTIPATPSLACSCANTPTQVGEIAEIVFTGVAKAYGRTYPVERSIVVEFQVGAVYKGAVPPRVQVQAVGGQGPSGGLGPGCEYGFELGRQYTVFAIDHDSDGLPNTNGCFWNVEGPITPSTYGLPSGQVPSRDHEVVRLAIVAVVALAAIVLLALLGRVRPLSP